jgi:F-type H+-transporting ATPase subunit epsilon
MDFQLEIICLTGTRFSGRVKEAVVPGLDGDMVILPRHMPLVAVLGVGEIVIKDLEDRETIFSVGRGMLNVRSDRVVILAEDIQSSDEILEAKVIEAKNKAEEIIANASGEEEKERGRYLYRKSLVDLKIVMRKKKQSHL